MAEVDVGLPIPLPSGGYLDPRYASSSDLIDPRIIFGSPVQTGMNNAAEAQAMDPITQFLMMKAAEEASDRSGLTDTIKNSPPGKLARTVLGGLLDAIVPPAQAAETGQAADAGFAGQPVVAESPAMPPVQQGEPTLEQVRAMNYVPDSQIPMEGRRLPTNERILVRQDWEGPGRGVFDPARMSDREISIEEEAMQTASDLLQMGGTSMPDVGRKAAIEATTGEGPGFLPAIKNFLGDEEKMLKLAMAFNTLRHRPDANLAQYATKRIETLGAQRQTNRTADALLAKGLITPDQAEMIRMGLAEQAFGTDKFSRILEMMKTEEGMAKLLQLKELGALGGGVNVDLGQKGWGEVDKEFAKEFIDWRKGGKATAMKNIGTLRSVITQLSSPEGGDLTGVIPGLLPDIGLQLFMPDSKDARDRVASVVQLSMKEILGAQFTEKEGAQLIRRSYDEALSPEQNLARLNAMVMQLEAAAAAKDQMVDYFSKGGTLMGLPSFEMPTASDFEAAMDAAAYSPAAAKARVRANEVPAGVPSDMWAAMNDAQREKFLKLSPEMQKQFIGLGQPVQ